MRKLHIIALSGLIILSTGCGPGSQESGESQVNYKEVKDMVVDILKTEEGKKAIEEAQSGETGTGMHANMLTSTDNAQISLAVKEVLTSPEYEKKIEEMMKDPKFAGDFAKTVMKGNKQLHKDLMKDPQYQKSITDLMKDPEIEKMFLDLMKGTQYRKQTMAIMQESFQSPLFRMEVLELLDKVVEKQLKPDEEKKAKESGGSSGGGEEGGGGGGGESGSGSGG
ncbi:spore gernimation protein [Paenibacillus swuensis]|uniref:Spore gernimation protein n=1 Tax=Paenibacillus swuensis TaxID=1178515 RepID=A0A172TIE8_9BACL|nr:spore germination lipoprotein GerD [Paenibacillus swuensis]ANE46818.1 spore gernimation protein [Paenibacillus swuensis]